MRRLSVNRTFFLDVKLAADAGVDVAVDFFSLISSHTSTVFLHTTCIQNHHQSETEGE